MTGADMATQGGQSINSHGTDLVCSEYSGFSTKRVNYGFL